MDEKGVCAPLLVEADAQNNTMNSPNAASVIDSDKVINTKIDSTQVEDDKSEEGLLKGLLTDDYCYVCEAVLLFESQRLSHYEGKKHAHKLRMYLQTKRGGRINKEVTGSQVRSQADGIHLWQNTKTDKNRFCELCNMVFTSHTVAKSHYEGKIHTKNLRKQGFQPQVAHRYTLVHRLGDRDPDNAVQKTTPDNDVEVLDQAATTNAPTEVDLMDPNKYCSLCAASFNNPLSAAQHYKGRKHYKNKNRQELFKKLADDTLQADPLMCKVCNVQFNSVEMHQAHMNGNRHHIREKKVTDLCQSQQKAYSTFADELSDYIQIQKARGITPRPAVLPSGESQKDEVEEEELLMEEDVVELSKPAANCTPRNPGLGRHIPFEGWWPPPRGSPRAAQGLNYNFPPPSLPCSSAPFFSSSPMKRRHKMVLSPPSISNSSSSFSSCSSSYSSTSESDSSEYSCRKKKRMRRSREERDNNQQRREMDQSEDGGKGGFTLAEKQKRGKNLKHWDKQGKCNKKPRVENSEEETMTDTLKQDDTRLDQDKTGEHIQTDTSDVMGAGGQDELSRHRYRKDRKKLKEKADTRTEEEKLWDDSIMGF